MVALIKNIEAEDLKLNTGSVSTLSQISGVVGQEDYINLYGFIGFLQNFTKINTTTSLDKPLLFGLKNNRNIEIVNLELDY